MGPINLVASISTPHINLCMSNVIWCQWFSWKHFQSSTNFIQFSLRLHISRMDYSVCIELDWWQAQQAKSECTVSLQSCLNKSVTYCQTSLCMFWLTTVLYGFSVRGFHDCFCRYFWNLCPQLKASEGSLRKILMPRSILICFLLHGVLFWIFFVQ